MAVSLTALGDATDVQEASTAVPGAVPAAGGDCKGTSNDLAVADLMGWHPSSEPGGAAGARASAAADRNTPAERSEFPGWHGSRPEPIAKLPFLPRKSPAVAAQLPAAAGQRPGRRQRLHGGQRRSSMRKASRKSGNSPEGKTARRSADRSAGPDPHEEGNRLASTWTVVGSASVSMRKRPLASLKGRSRGRPTCGMSSGSSSSSHRTLPARPSKGNRQSRTRPIHPLRPLRCSYWGLRVCETRGEPGVLTPGFVAPRARIRGLYAPARLSSTTSHRSVLFGPIMNVRLLLGPQGQILLYQRGPRNESSPVMILDAPITGSTADRSHQAAPVPQQRGRFGQHAPTRPGQKGNSVSSRQRRQALASKVSMCQGNALGSSPVGTLREDAFLVADCCSSNRRRGRP